MDFLSNQQCDQLSSDLLDSGRLLTEEDNDLINVDSVDIYLKNAFDIVDFQEGMRKFYEQKEKDAEINRANI